MSDLTRVERAIGGPAACSRRRWPGWLGPVMTVPALILALVLMVLPMTPAAAAWPAAPARSAGLLSRAAATPVSLLAPFSGGRALIGKRYFFSSVSFLVLLGLTVGYLAMTEAGAPDWALEGGNYVVGGWGAIVVPLALLYDYSKLLFVRAVFLP